jgi:CBS domain containing-hemolysin-like protein
VGSRASTVKTKDMLEDGAYSASDFVQGVNQLYPENESFGERASVNRGELDKMLHNNWLINPAAKTEDDDFETLGGLVYYLTERLPNVGERVYYQNLELTIHSVENNRVKKLRVKVQERPQPSKESRNTK